MSPFLSATPKAEAAEPDAATAPGRAVGGRPGAVADAADDRREVDLEALVPRLAAAFRRHPHVGNVLTHICGAQWERVAQALRAIFAPTAASARLSPLADNLVELMWAERGVTGRILKPYLRELLASLLPRRSAERLLDHVAALSLARQARPLPLPRDKVRTRRARRPREGGAMTETSQCDDDRTGGRHARDRAQAAPHRRFPALRASRCGALAAARRRS